MIERRHKFIIDALIKMINEKIANWIENLSIVLWIDRITIKQSIDHTSFYFNCDFEFLMSIELNFSIWRIFSWNEVHIIENLLTMRARQIQRRDENLKKIVLFFWRMKEQEKESFDLFHWIKNEFMKSNMTILLHDIKLDNMHIDKFQFKWLRLYFIQSTIVKDTYILVELNEIQLVEIYFENRLKIFHIRQQLNLSFNDNLSNNFFNIDDSSNINNQETIVNVKKTNLNDFFQNFTSKQLQKTIFHE